MPVLLVNKFHYLVSHETLRKIAMDREMEDNHRDYHWKIYGINEEKSLVTTIYLFDTMEQALIQKQEVEIIAELQGESIDSREFNLYEIMVDQSLLCKAPILMADIGVNGIEQIFVSDNQTQHSRILK
jgi:hypothetical protein